MPKLPPSNYADIGNIGEDLVAQWLESTGWKIIHRRFSCRWGEIDIIAEYQHQTANLENPTLAFVEVKTRSSGSWDAGGRNAITVKKQIKLCRTAQVFLSQYPQKLNHFCRFDVALVFYDLISKKFNQVKNNSESLVCISQAGYDLQLLEYIPAAFDMSIMTG